MSRWQNIDGRGAVLFEDDGSVRLFVSDEVAELVAAAEKAGLSADDIVNKILDAADADDVQRMADGTRPIARLEPPAWHPDYS